MPYFGDRALGTTTYKQVNVNKRIVIATLFWVGFGVACAQKTQPVALTPRVDERVELLSILARLAGYDEYTEQQHKAYVTAIEQHFAPYKKHPAVAYMRRVRNQRSIGYDAVMNYAVQLDGAPNWMPLIPFADQLPDKRWTVEDATNLASLIQAFYRDAQCADFFRQQQTRYRQAESRFANVARQVDVPWFGRFYGQPPTQAFELVLGLGNGGGNFGPHFRQKNGTETVYAIMGTWSADSTGEAQYAAANYLPTVIHEFNHSFANALIDSTLSQLQPAADTVYARVAEPMRRQAYGNARTMLYESLVRAGVVMYLQEHEPDGGAAREQLRKEQANSFVWTDTLVGLLQRYEANRNRCPTLASFMPEHTAFYQRLAPRIDTIMSAYEDHLPNVVVIEPFKNQSQTVDPATAEISIRFDKPMNPKRIGIQLGDGGRNEMPLREVTGFSGDNRTFRATMQLKPNQTYSFKLRPGGFQTVDGYPSKAYTISFKTAAGQ